MVRFAAESHIDNLCQIRRRSFGPKSSGYAPNREHGINPLDPEVGIDWPTVDRSGSPSNVILSEKDTAAPSLAEAELRGYSPNTTR